MVVEGAVARDGGGGGGSYCCFFLFSYYLFFMDDGILFMRWGLIWCKEVIDFFVMACNSNVWLWVCWFTGSWWLGYTAL